MYHHQSFDQIAIAIAIFFIVRPKKYGMLDSSAPMKFVKLNSQSQQLHCRYHCSAKMSGCVPNLQTSLLKCFPCLGFQSGNLLSFFLRKVHREKEQAFELSMKLYRDATPGDVGVPLKLFPQDPGALQGSYPYESAVQELKLVITDCCPQRKLECIGESDCVVFIIFSHKG